MSQKKAFTWFPGIAFIAFCITYIRFGNFALLIAMYVIELVFYVVRLFIAKVHKKDLLFYTAIYFCLIVIFILSIGTMRKMGDVSMYLRRSVGIFLLMLPLLGEYVYRVFYHPVKRIPVLNGVSNLSYETLIILHQKIQTIKDDLKNSNKALSRENIIEIIGDLPRHSIAEYINKDTLTEAYFAEAEQSLEDPYVYIVITNSGSAASGIISVFTKKPYNHVSLSFDAQLKTLISYNGGEKVFPPGLNKETLNFFSKSSDASILIYRIKITRQKKEILIDRIKNINTTGSAYNLVGLVTKHSIRPNIMFCSQFVYTMLEEIQEEYFKASPFSVTPTDFIEKDYYRKLEFVDEISLKTDSKRLQGYDISKEFNLI